MNIRGKIGIGAGSIIGIILIILIFTNLDILFPNEVEEFMTKAEFANPTYSPKINTECELINFLNDQENTNNIRDFLMSNEEPFKEKYYNLGGTQDSSLDPQTIANQDRIGWNIFVNMLMEEFLVNPDLEPFLIDLKEESPQYLIAKIKQNDPDCEIGEGVLNPKSEPIPPKNAGPLGGEHVHVGILVKILGETFDFSTPAFQMKSSWIHFERNEGTTIHKHATGVTMGYLFDTLGLGLDHHCFVLPDGMSFCDDETYSIKFFINGEPVIDIQDYIAQHGDKILISYGAETPQQIEQQLSELNNQELIE